MNDMKVQNKSFSNLTLVDFEKLIEKLEKIPEIQKLPPQVRTMLENSLKNIEKVPFPIVSFKENEDWIASTPVIDLCAQGETEKEAIENLESMIKDYMNDPDTQKPEISSAIDVHVGIKNISISPAIITKI